MASQRSEISRKWDRFILLNTGETGKKFGVIWSKYIAQQIFRLPVPFFHLFSLLFSAFHPPVISNPTASECILSNSLQHSHCIRKHLSSLQKSYCIRKHSAPQSTTPPLHQETFCPTVYNYPIASGSILPNSLQHPHCNRKHFVQQSTTIPLHQEAVCPTVYNIPTATGSILPNKLQHAHCIRKHFSNSLQHNKNKLTNTRQPNKCLLEYTGYMFRLVNRSSSWLMRTKIQNVFTNVYQHPKPDLIKIRPEVSGDEL